MSVLSTLLKLYIRNIRNLCKGRKQLKYVVKYYNEIAPELLKIQQSSLLDETALSQTDRIDRKSTQETVTKARKANYSPKISNKKLN